MFSPDHRYGDFAQTSQENFEMFSGHRFSQKSPQQQLQARKAFSTIELQPTLDQPAIQQILDEL